MNLSFSHEDAESTVIQVFRIRVLEPTMLCGACSVVLAAPRSVAMAEPVSPTAGFASPPVSPTVGFAAPPVLELDPDTPCE